MEPKQVPGVTNKVWIQGVTVRLFGGVAKNSGLVITGTSQKRRLRWVKRKGFGIQVESKVRI